MLPPGRVPGVGHQDCRQTGSECELMAKLCPQVVTRSVIRDVCVFGAAATSVLSRCHLGAQRDHVQLRWEQMMVGLLRLRLTAGVCVLAAALLVGAGGAVAVGDPGSSGSAARGDHETNASGQPQSTGGEKPKDKPGGTDTKDGSRGSGGQPDQQQSTAAKKPTDEPGGTDTKDGSRGSGRQPDQQQSTAAIKPNDEPGGTDTKDGTKDDSDGGATVSEPVDAVSDEVGAVV